MTRTSLGPRFVPVPALVLAPALALTALPASTVAQDLVAPVLRELNETRSVQGTEESKSYPVLFDALLAMSPPPMELGAAFNVNAVHPGMSQWDRVSGWVESNPGMAEAILACEERTLFGLPYGLSGLDARYREADLVADIGHDGNLYDSRLGYIDAIELIATYATAETYRLYEAKETGAALELAVATTFVLRQCCDREFLDEQLNNISLLSAMLGNLRDQMYLYRDDFAAEQLSVVAREKVPFLRPDRNRLFMPEGDRIVAEALIRDVFDPSGSADREKFAETFAAIQSEDQPLTRFGAARRWRMIAEVHDSLDSSLERLQLIYDDWWRRWRVQEYDPILDIPTQFSRTNSVRFAAVIYSMQNIEGLFDVRNELIAQVNGTALAAGLAAYHRTFGTYPDDTEKMYTTLVRKRSDSDPFDFQFKPFRYRDLPSRFAVSTPYGSVWLDAGAGLLYSLGMNHEDDRGAEHTDDGIDGDIVLWPPIKAVLREEGLLP